MKTVNNIHTPVYSRYFMRTLDFIKTRFPLLRQISVYTLALIVTQFLNFIGMVLTSRFLGPVSFGIYSFIQIYTATISTIFIATDSKFHADLARENSDERLRTIAIYFYNKLFLTLIVCLLGIIVSFIVLPYDLFILTTISLFPFIFSAISVWTSYAIFERKIYILSLSILATSGTLLLLKGIIIWQKLSIVYLIIATSLDIILFNGILFIIFFSRNTVLTPALRKHGVWWFSNMRQTFKAFLLDRENTLAIIYILLWQTLILRADQFIISALSDAYTLGIYSIAIKLTEATNVFVSSFSIAMLPRLQQLASSQKNTTRGIIISLSFGMFLSLILCFIAPWAVPLLFGATYLASIPIVQIYAFTIPFLFTGYYITKFFTHKKMYATLTILILVSGGVGSLCTIFLFQQYGLTGAAFGSVITYALFTFLGIYIKFHTKYGTNNSLSAEPNNI